MSHLSTPFDSDLDSFLNLDQNDHTPISASSSSRPTPSLFSQSSTGTFAAPSFQYDAYRQQTGLPVGGLANTFAVNQQSGLQYYGYNTGFVMPVDTLNLPLSKLDDFDFAHNPSLDMSDMDFDNESPADLPTMFFPPPTSSESSSLTPVVGNIQPEASTPIQRMYPGMHSQQAAAKAMQAQKQEVARQQQQKQLPSGQKSLPSQSKTQLTKDPVVEESISRLLSQMRNNSTAAATTTSDFDDAASPDDSSSMPRIKKDEDDMDDDERLLNSEEGKKLTSKERRQLRNKVSARAFRSRRKEYIGQLEGEVAAKVQEADELRAQNHQLMEENNRLTDLTRMLLSSQAFSTFLRELSTSGLPPSTMQASQPVPRPQQQSTSKDINPSEAARQLQSQQSQVNMAFMPEQTVDMSMLEAPTRWTSSNATHDYQVFSLTDLPTGPSNLTASSSKATTDTTPVRISPELLRPSVMSATNDKSAYCSNVGAPSVVAQATRSPLARGPRTPAFASRKPCYKDTTEFEQCGVSPGSGIMYMGTELGATYARADQLMSS